MTSVDPHHIRNFSLIGHGTSGKTILSEAFLYNAGQVNRIGRIEDGTTISDYHDDEVERQISINSTLLTCQWMDMKFNILDAPGFLDFSGEVKSALRVSDFAVTAVHGVTGPEAGTDVAWRFARDYGLPRLVAVTMLDKENCHFDSVVETLRERYSRRIVPFQLPLNPGPGFNRIVDVLRKKVLTHETDGSGSYREEEVPEDWADRVETLHDELIEDIAESDDVLLEKFFDQGSLSEDELRAGLHDAIRSGSLIPLVCTAAGGNIGVRRLMELIAKYCPSPADLEVTRALKAGTDEEEEIPTATEAPASLFVFKTVSEPHVGELSFFRVYSGSVKSGMDLKNTSRQTSERLGQLFVMNGKSRRETGSLISGDMGAVVKLKNTHTGDTLCDRRLSIELPKIDFPLPNIHEAVVTKSKGDEEKIATGLATLHEEDPTFLFRVDPELKQTIISGQGELQLEIVTERLKRKFNVDVDLVEPRVPYRETVRSRGESKYRHKKQTGGAGQFAEVWMTVEPLPRGSGVEFENSLVGQSVDRVFVPSVEKGVKSACEEGILAGYKVVDVKANFYDGKQHPVDSKDIAFQIAGKEAFKESFLAAQPSLLEPIYEIEVRVPEEYMGDVMGDISGRRGKILGMDSEGDVQIIRALIPQANLYRYSTSLRSLTGGRSTHTEKFSHYEELPRELEQKIVEASKRKNDSG
ncbi:MAG: elongation factor G [Fidelibacterota bacterium]